MGLEAASEIIPVVGSALKIAAKAKQFKDRLDIQNNMKKISSLIPFTLADLIARYIASKLTIKRRNFITNLTYEDVCS